MALAYLDAFSGISGDMTIGAFLDLGMPLELLEAGLAPLEVTGYRLQVGRRVRSGIGATKFTVDLGEPDPGLLRPLAGGAPPAPLAHAHGGDAHTHQVHGPHRHERAVHGPHRHYRDVRALLERAPLTPRVRERALRVFRALAIAEGKVHGTAADDVVFHEVGAIDAIVDVVGARSASSTSASTSCWCRRCRSARASRARSTA